nr:zinc finger, CCHC-type [Tanacetum cinerariifolium]
MGEFSLSSVRNYIDEFLLPKAGTPTRWIKLVPIKLNITAWRICLDKLPTSLLVNSWRKFVDVKDKLNYLELPILDTPVLGVPGQQVPHETLAAPAAWVKGQKEIVVLRLMTMKQDLQRNLETLEYDSFVQNYNMHDMGKTINELHAMLKLHEQPLPKRDSPSLHAIRAGKVQKKNKNKKPQVVARGNNKGKGKSKIAYAPKPKIPPPLKKQDPTKDSKKKLPQGASTSGIFTIELFTFPGKSWVYDTGYETHICNTTQGFRRSRKPKPGSLSLYIGNDQRAAVKANGSYDLYGSLYDGQTTLPKSFWDYALESAARILNMVPTKKVENTPYEVWSTRTRHAPNRMCLNIEPDEYELGDLNEPANYKAALSDLEFDKWLKPMNVKMQSMKDNEVWDLVNLPSNGKTVGANGS